MRIISCDVLVSILSELQTKSSAVTIAILNQELKSIPVKLWACFAFSCHWYRKLAAASQLIRCKTDRYKHDLVTSNIRQFFWCKSELKTRDFVTYSTNQGSEVSKIFSISLSSNRERERVCGGGGRPYSETRPTKLTNHSEHVLSERYYEIFLFGKCAGTQGKIRQAKLPDSEETFAPEKLTKFLHIQTSS